VICVLGISLYEVLYCDCVLLMQAQQLFAHQKWPKGLFREEQDMTLSGRGQ
jgi:hypothetical protein